MPAGTTGSVLLFEARRTLAGEPDILARLSRGELDDVLAAGRQIAFTRHESLFRQGEPHRGIFILRSGTVRSFYSSPTGREITLAKWKPGNFVGGPDIFGNEPHVWSGVGIEPGEAINLPGKTVRRLMTSIPNFAVGLIDGLAFKGKCYSALLQILGTRSVLERLAYLLFNLAEDSGVTTDDGVAIPGAPSHEELAGMVGATRQWVSMTIGRFSRAGLLRVEPRRIVILQMNAIRALADGNTGVQGQ